jgi:hypothetical protein
MCVNAKVDPRLPLRHSAEFADGCFPACGCSSLDHAKHCVEDCKADSFPQNLIPLCIRPLRLILPSERLRSARIVLLKASHVPFVAAIWAYEQIADARKRNSSMMSFSGPQTPLPSKKPPRLAVNTPRLLLADSHAMPESPGRMQQVSRSHNRVGQVESEVQLKTLVLKLTSQVEQLTEMMSQLQEQQREANMAA